MDYKKTANVKFQGGIGNQFFQFAFATYLKEHFNLTVLADMSWYDDPNNRTNILSKFIKQKYHFAEIKFLRNNYLNKILNRSEKLITYFLKKNKLLTFNFNGYWQNIFFASYLKKNFNYFHPEIFDKQIQKEYYIFHLRRGDFKTSKIHYLLEDKFYMDNFYFFKKKKIIILSENKNDGLILKNKLNSSDIEIMCLPEVEAFSLIYNAKGGISSNSSFCWWAIYLSNNRNWIMPYQWLKNESIFDKNLQIKKTLVV